MPCSTRILGEVHENAEYEVASPPGPRLAVHGSLLHPSALALSLNSWRNSRQPFYCVLFSNRVRTTWTHLLVVLVVPWRGDSCAGFQ